MWLWQPILPVAQLLGTQNVSAQETFSVSESSSLEVGSVSKTDSDSLSFGESIDISYSLSDSTSLQEGAVITGSVEDSVSVSDSLSVVREVTDTSVVSDNVSREIGGTDVTSLQDSISGMELAKSDISYFDDRSEKSIDISDACSLSDALVVEKICVDASYFNEVLFKDVGTVDVSVLLSELSEVGLSTYDSKSLSETTKVDQQANDPVVLTESAILSITNSEDLTFNQSVSVYASLAGNDSLAADEQISPLREIVDDGLVNESASKSSEETNVSGNDSVSVTETSSIIDVVTSDSITDYDVALGPETYTTLSESYSVQEGFEVTIVSSEFLSLAETTLKINDLYVAENISISEISLWEATVNDSVLYNESIQISQIGSELGVFLDSSYLLVDGLYFDQFNLFDYSHNEAYLGNVDLGSLVESFYLLVSSNDVILSYEESNISVLEPDLFAVQDNGYVGLSINDLVSLTETSVLEIFAYDDSWLAEHSSNQIVYSEIDEIDLEEISVLYVYSSDELSILDTGIQSLPFEVIKTVGYFLMGQNSTFVSRSLRIRGKGHKPTKTKPRVRPKSRRVYRVI